MSLAGVDSLHVVVSQLELLLSVGGHCAIVQLCRAGYMSLTQKRCYNVACFTAMRNLAVMFF